MPELPEVTTIVSQLKKEIVGHKVIEVETIEGYRTEPPFGEFRAKIRNKKVASVERVAKTIVVGLGDRSQVIGQRQKFAGEPSPNISHLESVYLVIHLAMTGRLLLRSKGFKADPWLRLVFSFDDGRELRFTDPRMFGYVRLVSDLKLKEHQEKYGPDPLDNSLTPLTFLNRLRLKKTMVKRALLEQGLVSGVGNIYANDSLWMAQIHPETPSENLSLMEAGKLLEALRIILKESIKHRGSTLGDKMYLDLYGQAGEHQDHLRVFGKNGQACARCQSPILYKEIGGRGTFFCGACQLKSTKKITITAPPENQSGLI